MNQHKIGNEVTKKQYYAPSPKKTSPRKPTHIQELASKLPVTQNQIRNIKVSLRFPRDFPISHADDAAAFTISGRLAYCVPPVGCVFCGVA